MKKHTAIFTAALLGLALAACNKNDTSASSGNGGNGGGGGAPQSAASVETQMRAAYGFAAQMPADTASYSGFYNLMKLWQDFKGSATWASIKANPLVSQALNEGPYQDAMSQASTNPEAVKWMGILKDAFGTEAFIALAHGSEAKLHAWIQLNQTINAARYQSLMAGEFKSSPEQTYLPAILSNLKDLDIPPMIIGFKITSQKAALDAELQQGISNLPPFVETGTFKLDGGQSFQSLAVTVSKAMPQELQDGLKQMIAANISDPQKADETFQSLLSRRLEIAYGYMGDYFIISIGPDHSHLKFADNYGASLLALPEVQKAADYTGKPVVSFSWGTKELMDACQQQLQLMAYYEKMKEQIAQTLSPSDVAKLETNLTRLDAEGKSVFNRETTPMVSVQYRDHGLRGEVFGGIKYGGAGAAMKFSQVPTASTFLWMDHVEDTAFSDAARVWIEDFASTAYDIFQQIGLPRLPDDQRPGVAMLQNLAVPKFVEFYKITRDQFAKSLGPERALAVDLNGEVPDSPMVPPDLHTGGKMIRLAVLSEVHDRALLAQSWDAYFKLAGEIAQMTPAAMMFPNGLPQPQSEVVDGVTLSYYTPMPLGDLLPIVAVTDKTFVASTSRSYSLELTKAAASPAADPKPMALDLRVNFQPAFDFADKWLALAVQDPDLFFKGDEDKAAEFKKSEPDIASLLQALRAFDGISVQFYEENGEQRISSELRWTGK